MSNATTPDKVGPAIYTRVCCVECGRVFDLLNDEVDAAEWSTGHDCEA